MPRQRSEADRAKLLLLGDSLTQLCFEGWGSDLANMFQRRADVLNRGMSGYNTRWYLRYAEDNGIWEEPGNIVLVTIFFGANDAALPERDPAKHVPLPEYQTNLEIIIEKAKEAYAGAKILLIAPPPVHRGQRLKFQKDRYGEKATGIPERTSEHTGKYAAVCREVANTKKIPCLDLFDIMRNNEGNSDEEGIARFFWDGLHFSKTGQKFVYDALANAIHTHFPGLEVRPCPITGQFNNSSSVCDDIVNSGPYHDKLNGKDWGKAFD
mmetsp:Transcript_8116/g.17490  ORF Transcript_8116/g.17490 Transcript_8116/m.17490 type:complete len:267 (-) Transcript_8116:238-1038(-)|eukprot:CAMPEP_0168185848 /NCGR_PEP_ID=MMETSP0139_2-20121125/14081_1 /TAXON_ID=44445 /ORGANISM="Pseudo-nitzschia australis, Strain 10249 10 AB" /LENGTH=266 /DNA_ID=CAMNT_0008107743 /DNA_START=1 /DNA_END=801 /DNA_ORIENTATION=+